MYGKRPPVLFNNKPTRNCPNKTSNSKILLLMREKRERYRQMNKGGETACAGWKSREKEIGVLLPLLNVLRSNLDEDKMSFFWLDPPDAINYLLINVPPWYIRGPLTPHHLISLLFFSALAISLLCTRLEEAAHGSRPTRPSLTYDITIKVGSHHLIPALRF